MPNQFIESKGLKDRLALFEHVIKVQWPDYKAKNICVGEIGCGNRSAMSYLCNLGLANVDYVGIDISIKMMRLAANEQMPKNWKTQFARISANKGVFKENSLDLVICDGVLSSSLSLLMCWNGFQNLSSPTDFSYCMIIVTEIFLRRSVASLSLNFRRVMTLIMKGRYAWFRHRLNWQRPNNIFNLFLKKGYTF